jgi:hypothetical protein
MKKILFVIVLSVMANSMLHADWDKTYGGEGNDFGNAIIQTPDGGFLIAGSTASFGSIARKFNIGYNLTVTYRNLTSSKPKQIQII